MAKENEIMPRIDNNELLLRAVAVLPQKGNLLLDEIKSHDE